MKDQYLRRVVKVYVMLAAASVMFLWFALVTDAVWRHFK